MAAALNNLVSQESGLPLSRPVRRRLEREAGTDFDLDPVRVHSSRRVRAAVRALHAEACTLGKHIAFSSAVNASASSGYATLLHEIAHTNQQYHAWPVQQPAVDPSPHLERAARRGDRITSRLSAQAVQRQETRSGPAPRIRFARLSATAFQVIVGGVRIGSVRVRGETPDGAQWFHPAHVIQSGRDGYVVDIGLVHTPGVTVSFYARNENEVMPLLEERSIYYPSVESIQVPAGTTPQEFGAQLSDLAGQLTRSPVTEMDMEAPSVEVGAAEIYRSRPARTDQEPQQQPGEQAEEEWNIGTMLLHTLMGEWEEDPYISSIVLDTGIGFIPVVDQLLDGRDLTAHLYFMIADSQYSSILRWVGLVFSLIGAIPEVGTAIKGISKILIRGGQAAFSYLDELWALIRRVLPDDASLPILRRYIVSQWDEWVVYGRDLWMRSLDATLSRLRSFPDFVSERYVRIVERIRTMSPSMLDEAFAEVREQITETLRYMMNPSPGAVMTPNGLQMAMPTGPVRGADNAHMSSLRDEMHELSGGGRSTSAPDLTHEERMRLGGEVASRRGGRIDRLERHHTVFVFVLRAIQAQRSGRAPGTLTRASAEGFRQIVDDLFPQGLVNMERAVHADLHRHLNNTLDELLEPRAVAERVARAAGEMRDQGWLIVQRGGTRQMLERLQHLTENELLSIVEEAYMRVYREHPGLISDDIMRETMEAIDQVRRGL